MSHNFHNEGNIGRVAFTLVIIGALAWGILGAFNYNVISSIFGEGILTRAVYHLIGISALFVVFRKFFREKHTH